MFIVSVDTFNGRPDNPARPDINGKMPVIITAHNGELPTRARVIPGTVAENAGLIPGKIYLLKVAENGSNEYGTRYTHQVIGTITAIEFATNYNSLPKGHVDTVSSTPTSKAEDVPEVASKFK